MAKRTAQDIRRRNRFDALRCVFAASGPVSRQEVAAATGLSFATVANLVAELLEAGVLREAGHEDSKGGRPRARLAVNAERGALVGIDVAETSVQVELFDLALTVRRSVRLPLPQTGVRPDDVVDAIVTGVEGLSDAAGTPPRILGAGVSIPGLVEREGGVSVFSPYWSWRDVPLRSLLAERLPMPLYLDNPLKAGTVAEMWFGAGREVDDLLVLTLRAGVGAGIAVDGALYRGATNSAGEWGHTCLVRDGRECRCGRRGCVEAYVSTRGIARTVRELDAESPLLDPDEDAVVSNVARAAAEGDAVATETVARTARHLGEAAADLLNLFNPQALVLGGRVADRLGEPLLRQTRDVIAAHALPATLQALTFRLSTVPDNPVSLGAATFALEGFLDDRATFPAVAAGRRAARAAKAGTP
ncbi:transcriptional regulator [Streptomyces virginiae]|uniref:Transcriptional regulator n=1 Tax=Streptomyces virginiae TaxID=1961 RepID=A0A0L8M520_STRVG|nr:MULTISPECIES: ROK family protein [Streptomyces]KOG45527.1 transcriptional regulator [Streptomyces virginiae]KOU27874.1 transcriptional regulator [Streptomyces sp. WM6368]